MNRIQRFVRNRVSGAWVPVAETTRGRSKSGRAKSVSTYGAVGGVLSLLGLAPLALASPPAAAPCVVSACNVAVSATSHPLGGQVVSGRGSISQSGETTTIRQSSQNLFLDWLSFNVGSDETVNFVQPSASAIAVNEIFSTNGSQILGHLNANGEVWLVNPNGIVFGEGAQVNVGGLVASTLNNVTLSGDTASFSGNGAGSLVNEGTINAATGGSVALLGNHVSNQGTITAKLGSVALGAGTAVTLTFNGNSLVKMQVDQSTLNTLAENGGVIQADGGTVILSAGAKNALLASVVNNTGIIEARTVENHDGTIELLGGMTAGTVNVGGTLDASAPNGGNGGFIETNAAHVEIADDAKVTSLAATGKTGTWLIDPTDFTIAASGGDITGVALATELDSGNVTIQSSQGSAGTLGNIYVNASVTPAPTAATTLTLDAIGSILINDPIKSTASALNLSLNTAVTGNVTLAAALTLAGGNVNVGTYTSGTVTPSVGTMDVTAGTTTLTGTLSTGTLAISGGTLALDTATTIPTLSLTGGTLNGVGAISTGNLTWSNATLLGSLTLNSGGTGTLSGGETFGNGTTAGAGTFTNTGTITDNTPAGYYSLFMNKNSKFYNQGSYTVTGNPLGFYASDTTSLINNSGTFTANPGTGNTLTVHPTFTNTNTGTVNVSSGTLTLGTNGVAATHSGAFTVASGSTLDFIGGTQTITSTGSVSGAGTLEVDSGTLNYDGSYTLNSGIVITGGTANFTPTTGTMTPSSLTISGGTANFNTAISTPSVVLSGGTLNGAIGVNTNNLTWSGATLLGSLTLTSGGTGTLSGDEYFGNGTTAGAGTFTNTGTITDNTPAGYYSLYMSKNSTFYNQGSYTVTGNPAGFYATDATSSFNNSGTFTANPGTGNTLTVYPTFTNTNTGTVNVNSGTLTLTDGLTQSGTINVAKSSVFSEAAGFTNTGTLAGSGKIVVGTGTSKLINEGNIDPGGTGVAGTLTITGAVQLSTGSDLNMELGGTAAGQFDVLSVSGALSGNASSFGALTLSEINGYVPTVLSGTSFQLVKAGSGASSTAFAPFHLARTTSSATYAATNITVNVAPDVLTVTPTSGQSTVYGTTDPTFTFTATGFDPTTSDDTANSLSGLLARAAGSNAGTYGINQGTLVSTDGYLISFTSGVNFSITPATLTVSGLSGTNRTYNGSVIDAFSGTAVLNGLVGTDTLTLGNAANGTLASANAGSEAIATGLTISNGTGLASNYTLVQPTLSNVTIAQAPLTITGLSGTGRIYDGTVVDALSGTAVLNGLVGSETLTMSNTGSGTLASKNAGSEAVATNVTLSNGTGLASNYVLTQPTLGNVTITPAALTISAVSDSKTYDGTTNSSQTPTVTAGTVFTGDSLSALTQSFASKNVLGQNGSTLNVNSITLNDGNGGNNYTVTVDSATGTITPASLVINAVSATKTYDATTNSTGIPTVTGTVFSGDTLSALTESFASKNVLGTNSSTLNVNSYTLSDGNNGSNYNVTVNSATGTITPLASVAWVGGATGNWSTASNWAGGIIPDLSNVSAVTIPAGKTVTYDSGVGGTTLLTTLTDSGNLIMAAGNLSTTGNLSTAGFQQTGGTLDVGGTLTIKSTSGGVTLGDMTAGILSVTSKAGAITQLASTAVAATGATTLTADNGLSGGNALYYGITLADAGNHFGGAVTSTGSNIDLMQGTGGLILGATTANGTLTVDSLAGAITQAASKSVIVTGASSLTADNGLSGGSDVKYGITLANTTNNFGGTVSADGLAISLLDDGTSGLTLGNVTAGGALTVTSRAGALTQAASTAVAATGATKLTADNGLSGGSALYYGITLADAGNHFGGAVTSTGSNIDLMQSTGGLILGATTATGTFTADSTAGAITQSASTAVNATGATSLTANNGGAVNYAITLGQANNNFLGGVTADGSAITLKDAAALTAVLDSSGASTLTSVGAMTVSGTVGSTLKTTTTGTNAATTFGATTVHTSLNVTSTGAVTETSSNILTVAGNVTTTAPNSNVCVNGTCNVEIPAP
jgi:filamentous hemagglutinin family protein